MSIIFGLDVIENGALSKKVTSIRTVFICKFMYSVNLEIDFLEKNSFERRDCYSTFPTCFCTRSKLLLASDTIWRHPVYMCTVHISGDYLYWWYNNGLCVFSVERSIDSNWNSWLDKASSGSLLDSVCGSRNRIIAI